METQAETAKNEDMKSKKGENEKKEKGGGGEEVARENLETSGTLIAKIAHQLFASIFSFAGIQGMFSRNEDQFTIEKDQTRHPLRRNQHDRS